MVNFDWASEPSCQANGESSQIWGLLVRKFGSTAWYLEPRQGGQMKTSDHKSKEKKTS